MPYKQVDEALQSYAAFLRDKVAAENLQVAATPPPASRSRRRRKPKYADVPDLNEIIALPQDEMRDIVGALQREWRGRRAAAGAADPADRRATWRSTRAGSRRCKSLDFDKLSRNAQVDYLFIRRTAETQIARAQSEARPQSAAQDGHERHSGPGARPRGPHPGSLRSDDSVHAGAADRARREGVRVVRGGNAEGLARDGLRRRLEEGDREDQGQRRPARRPAADDHGPRSSRPSTTCARTT